MKIRIIVLILFYPWLEIQIYFFFIFYWIFFLIMLDQGYLAEI